MSVGATNANLNGLVMIRVQDVGKNDKTNKI